MSPAVEVVLVTAAALSAFLAVALVVKGALAGGARTAGRASRMRVMGNLAPMHGAEGVERVVFTFAVGTEGAAQAARPHAGPIVARASDERIAGLLRHAGMEGALGVAGLRAARVRLAGFGAGAGFLLGVLLSWELGVLLALAGAALGYSAPVWALRRMEQRRALELERGLPEMLEVVALGLRSGLSFDRSLRLYGEHFPSSFAQACASAQSSWSLGLRTREEALRDLSRSYRSDQLERTVERIVRSLRFGSTLAPDLEAAASEARARHRAQVEERVAKAPVKMMVPTGALILPAMLILVLGPVLLELMQG